jgi:hypothetical protein
MHVLQETDFETLFSSNTSDWGLCPRFSKNVLPELLQILTQHTGIRVGSCMMVFNQVFFLQYGNSDQWIGGDGPTS